MTTILFIIFAMLMAIGNEVANGNEL